MKKIATLLLLMLAIFSNSTSAQSTSVCNAQFGIQQLNWYTFQFNPVTSANSQYIHHYWSFGDGGVSSEISPSHPYSTIGTFTVRHYLYKTTVAGALDCIDSTDGTVHVLQQPCNLHAGFFITPITATPNSFHFENTSAPLDPTDSIRWTFGDGSSSTDLSPNHTYTQPGVYNVCLRVKKVVSAGNPNICVSEICDSVVVAGPCNIVSSFTITPLTATAGSFHFENTSAPLAPTDSIRWTFGDGSTSTDLSPNHTYTQPGTYNVCLRVKKLNSTTNPNYCVSEICHTVVVTLPCNLVTSFTITPWPGAPNSYFFDNTSTPLNAADSIRWTFGDGTESYSLYPYHTYAQPGNYVVCLRIQVRDANGTLTNCIRETCHTISISTVPCNLVAGFTITPLTASPNSYHFGNTSSPLDPTDSIRWTFGDGTSSTDLSPNHTYAQAGNYTVCLWVKKVISINHPNICESQICHTIGITNPCNLVASFYSYPDSLSTVPNTYHFQNTSAPLDPTDSIRWTFGDGTSSNTISPNHTYAQPGTYTVCLRVQKRDSTGGLTTCIREICHAIYIAPPACNLVVSYYSYSDTTTTVPNTYHFENTSTPLAATDSIRWTFGNGTSSNAISPNHTYAQSGTYTVCLRVQKRDANGGLTTCVREICHTIVIAPVCNIQANFTWHTGTSDSLNIVFTNQTILSNSTATAVWSFGDGTSSTVWNPTHHYPHPGNYAVCLRVQSGPNCLSYFCDSITVHGTTTVSCNLQSDFSIIRASTNSQTFYFTPLHINTAYSYTWTFGDGTGSQDIYTSHHYSNPGNYTACLTVYRDSTCASTTCRPVFVSQQIICDSVHVSYTYYSDSSFPNKLYFHSTSNYPLINQTWTITRLNGTVTAPVILHQNNPYYIFADTGNYQVCLSAATSSNCIKTVCQVIHVSQVTGNTTCTLQVFPNPASTQVSVNLFLSQPQMINVVVYNMLNVVVAQQQQSGVAGNNIITIPVANLTAGYYTMKVIHGNDICYAQFLKL